jgi:hypothetical protein
MTSKRKPIGREVRYLYKKLLKEDGRMLNLKRVIGFYDEYNDLRGRVLGSREAPYTLKIDLRPLKMPLYLKWAKKYLV